MTESEWITSSDPQAMLGLRIAGPTVSWKGPSDRKLRLFACALEPMFEGHQWDYVTDWAEELEVYMQPEIVLAVSNKTTQAALLREIVGNPYRPVKITRPCDDCNGTGKWPEHKRECGSCEGSGRIEDRKRCPWLTPTVLALARAAYPERTGRKCERCEGHGYIPKTRNRDTLGDCTVCYGTGRIEDGTLDNERLAVLADALEEAGCVEPAIVNHLRSKCPACTDKTGFQWGKVADCHTCHGTGESSSHVRGCWVLDLLLGKE